VYQLYTQGCTEATMNLYLIARSSHIFAMIPTVALITAAEPLFLYAARSSRCSAGT
jgi:hypothetical protein